MNTRIKNLDLILLMTLTASFILSGCFSTDEGDGGSELSYQGFALSAEKDGKDSFNTKVDPKPLFENGKEAFEAAKLPYDDEVDVDEKPGLLPLPIDDTQEMRSRMVVISWGRGQDVSKKHDVRLWMGGIRADLARIRAHRLVGFEANDVLIRDNDMNRVTFSTQTRDHMDGVLLRVSSKSLEDVKQGHLSFQTIGFNHLIPLRDIFSGRQLTIPVDRNGNVLTVTSLRRRASCPHGFMKARWDRIDKRGGIFRGLLMGDEGARVHKIAGIWGKVGGAYRFKGFVLNSNGDTKGILKGTFQLSEKEGLNAASYRGHIVNADGEVIGRVRGIFSVPTDGPGQGKATGLWKVRCNPEPEACNDEIQLPVPTPLACICKPAVAELAPKEKPELTDLQQKNSDSKGKPVDNTATALDTSAKQKPAPVKPVALEEEMPSCGGALDATDANCVCQLPLPKPSDCVAIDPIEIEVKPEPTKVKPKPAQDTDETDTEVKPKPAQDTDVDKGADALPASSSDKG